MALLSELVATCAEQRLDAPGTLNVFARRLREAGRISSAGRGRGAAQMSYLDAARFLIACAATDHPERAVDAEFVFSNLVRDGDMGVDADFPMTKDEAPTLDMALAKLLEGIGTGKIDTVADARWKAEFSDRPRLSPAFFWLIVPRSGAAAELRLLGGRYHYHHPSLHAVSEVIRNADGPAATRVAQEAFSREVHRFRTAKNLTAELDRDLLRAVANLIAGSDQGEALE